MLWWRFNAMRQWEGGELMGGSMEEEEEGCGCGGWVQRNRRVEINQWRATRNRAAFQPQGHTADNGTSTTPGLSPKPCKTLPNWDPNTPSSWDPDAHPMALNSTWQAAKPDFNTLFGRWLSQYPKLFHMIQWASIACTKTLSGLYYNTWMDLQMWGGRQTTEKSPFNLMFN